MWVLDFVGINWSKLWRSLSADQQTHWTGKRHLLYNKLSHEHCICLKPKQAPRYEYISAKTQNTQQKNLKSKPRVYRWEKWTNECWWKGKVVRRLLTVNCTGSDFCSIYSICVTMSVGLNLSMLPCLHFVSICSFLCSAIGLIPSAFWKCENCNLFWLFSEKNDQN